MAYCLKAMNILSIKQILLTKKHSNHITSPQSPCYHVVLCPELQPGSVSPPCQLKQAACYQANMFIFRELHEINFNLLLFMLVCIKTSPKIFCSLQLYIILRFNFSSQKSICVQKHNFLLNIYWMQFGLQNHIQY